MCASVLALAACGDDEARDTADAGLPVDAPAPSITVRVAFEGNDADDGVLRPVETLRRAIAIATENPGVTHIELGVGRYTMRGGETFPYTVPRNVIGISGPPGGGAVLEGTGAEVGLHMTGGQIQNLELDQFAVAIEGAGQLRLKNLRVERSMVGIHTADGAKLRIDNLEMTGFADDSKRCATGIKLGAVSELTATTWNTHELGAALEAMNGGLDEGGLVDVTKASFTSTLGLTCSPGVFAVSHYPFSLSDSVIDGGYYGIFYYSNPVPLRIANVTLQHLRFGVGGSGGEVQMSDTTITDGATAGQWGTGTWLLTRVTISNNLVGLTLGGDPANGAAMLKMRGSTITTNRSGFGAGGIVLNDHAGADLGTSADPGNNVITSNIERGLTLSGTTGQGQVNAVGNTWMPNVQGADAEGHYPTVETITGPFPGLAGENFSLAAGWSLQR